MLVPKEVSVSSSMLLSMRLLDCLGNTSGEPSRLEEQGGREGGRGGEGRGGEGRGGEGRGGEGRGGEGD